MYRYLKAKGCLKKASSKIYIGCIYKFYRLFYIDILRRLYSSTLIPFCVTLVIRTKLSLYWVYMVCIWVYRCLYNEWIPVTHPIYKQHFQTYFDSIQIYLYFGAKNLRKKEHQKSAKKIPKMCKVWYWGRDIL